MPCRSYDYDDFERRSVHTEARLKKLSDKLARIACKAMDELVKQGKADFLLLKDKEVREWYEKHLEADRKAAEARAEKKRKAMAALKEKKRREHVRAEALSKLTDEEREILLGKGK